MVITIGASQYISTVLMENAIVDTALNQIGDNSTISQMFMEAKRQDIEQRGLRLLKAYEEYCTTYDIFYNSTNALFIELLQYYESLQQDHQFVITNVLRSLENQIESICVVSRNNPDVVKLKRMLHAVAPEECTHVDTHLESFRKQLMDVFYSNVGPHYETLAKYWNNRQSDNCAQITNSVIKIYSQLTKAHENRQSETSRGAKWFKTTVPHIVNQIFLAESKARNEAFCPKLDIKLELEYP